MDCGTKEVCKSCQCPHHRMYGVWIALIGLVFLLGHFAVVSGEVVSIAWPVIVLLAGLQKIFDRSCKCCNGCGCK